MAVATTFLQSKKMQPANCPSVLNKIKVKPKSKAKRGTEKIIVYGPHTIRGRSISFCCAKKKNNQAKRLNACAVQSRHNY